jgi:hypothetical protein
MKFIKNPRLTSILLASILLSSYLPLALASNAHMLSLNDEKIRLGSIANSNIPLNHSPSPNPYLKILDNAKLRDSLLLDIDKNYLNLNNKDSISRVIIINNNGNLDINSLSKMGVKVFNYLGSEDAFIAYAVADSSTVSMLREKGLKVINDFMLDFDSSSSNSKESNNEFINMPNSNDANRFDIIYGIDKVHAKGITGKGVNIAIVDSGVDFSSKDMVHAIALDSNGMPIMLDADGQGIVLTHTRFKAKIINGVIYEQELSDEEKKDPYTSNIYINDDGVFLNIKGKGGEGLKFDIYNPIYPYLGPPVLTAKANADWRIGKSNFDFINSKSGIYKMGFMVQLNFQLGRAALMIVPVLVVDSKEPNVYDTIIADMSTAWADFAVFELGKKLEEVNFDLDFTDEKPITLPLHNNTIGSISSSNNNSSSSSNATNNNNSKISVEDLMLTYDADKDGIADLSAGMLGAYVLDVWDVTSKKKDDNSSNTKSSSSNNSNTNYIDPNLGALSGRLLKPIDADGNYFTVMFDFFGHGTQSAGTIVSKGSVDYEIYKSSSNNNSNTITHRIVGIAPDAKIIPVKALWFGDIAYAWLWASGFDLIEEKISSSSSSSSNDSKDKYTEIISNDNNNSYQKEEGSNTTAATDANNSKEVIRWRWVYTGEHKADIINNSWGIPSVPLLGKGPGYDILSILASVLSIPGSLDAKYPGVIIVNSSGNSGHAYGTVTSPASSPLALSIGATTNNVIFTLQDFSKQPRFGNAIDYYDDIADFSSKGPTAVGDVKPDLLATGAYGYTPYTVNAKHMLNSKHAWGVFGGTSMSSPLTAGMLALVIQALKDKDNSNNSNNAGNNNNSNTNGTYDPIYARLILTNTAKDLKYDPFTQGSGRVDIIKALDYIEGKEGSFIVYTYDTYRNYIYSLKGSLEGYYNLASSDENKNYGYPSLSLPDKDIALSKWFAGYVSKGSSNNKSALFTVVNNSDSRLDLIIRSTTLKLIAMDEVKDKTEPRVRDEKFNTDDYGYIPKYVSINLDDNNNKRDADLLIAKLHYPFETFMNTSKDAIYANELRIASLYAYDWIDKDGNGKVSYDETAMISRAGAWGTAQQLMVSEPFKRVKGNMLIGIYQVPKVFSFWRGMSDKDSEAFDYTLTIAYYKRDRWDMLNINGADELRLSIEPHGKATFRASISIPEDAVEGIYQGYITIESSKQVTNIPVSFIVPLDMTSKDVPFTISNNNAGIKSKDDPLNLLYTNALMQGSFDMFSRYNAGEWKYYHLNVRDASVNTLSIKITWKNEFSSLSVFVLDPKGDTVASSVPAGVFKEFINWPSNDWLGRSIVGSGAFYPAQNNGRNSTVVYAPVNSPGIYTIMMHNTLLHAKDSFTEPLSIEVKPSTILADTKPPSVDVKIPSYYAKGLINLSIDVRDENLEHISYSIDDSMPSIVSNNNAKISIDTTKLDDGLHTLTIFSRDKVGHISINRYTFYVDNTPPSIEVKGIPTITTNSNSYLVSGVLNISIDVRDATLKNFNIILPDGKVIENEHDISIDTSMLSDGEHELRVYAYDNAGNSSESILRLMVDNTPPRVSIVSPADMSKVSGVLEVRYEVSDQNLKSVAIAVDGNAKTVVDATGSYIIDTKGLIDGEHKIEVIAEDMLGHKSSALVNINAVNYAPVIEAEKEAIRVSAKEQGFQQGTLIGIAVGIAVGIGAMIGIYSIRSRANR